MAGLHPTIHLDMYSTEFRKGYDAACVMSAMRQLPNSLEEENGVDAMFVRINKESTSLIEGLISENLFRFEYKNPHGTTWSIHDTDVWVRITPIKKRK